MRTLWQVLAIGCGISLTMLAGPIARAENATDKAIRAVLNQQVSLDCDRAGFRSQMERLSTAIKVPIELDLPSIQLLGITPGNGFRVHSGNRSAKELLELVMLKQTLGNDRLSFVIIVDEENRSPLGHKIVIVSHAYIEQRGWIVPPNDEEDAARIVTEHLSKRINIDAESDMPAGHWQRLSKLIEIPIDVDKQIQSLLSDESSKPFKLSVGERTAQEILDWTLVQATGPTALSYMIAEDPQRRFAHQIRLVIAKRTTKATNPARFSLPRRRQDAKPLFHDVTNDPITLQINDVKLRDTLDMISRQAKVTFRFDEQALKQAGISTDQSISLNISKRPLNRAVSLILGQVASPGNPLVFAVLSRPTKPDEILITTQGAAEKSRSGLLFNY
ncbi:MAG: hypothetical protein JNM18_07865 [Planctomycetaceae bacterium]|nr:hypothetical protein [Planctomycetaceae bacterium]